MTVKASILSALLMVSVALFAGANAPEMEVETEKKNPLELYYAALAIWNEHDQFQAVDADMQHLGAFEMLVNSNPESCKQVEQLSACFLMIEGELTLASGYKGEVLLFGLSAHADTL